MSPTDTRHQRQHAPNLPHPDRLPLPPLRSPLMSPTPTHTTSANTRPTSPTPTASRSPHCAVRS